VPSLLVSPYDVVGPYSTTELADLSVVQVMVAPLVLMLVAVMLLITGGLDASPMATEGEPEHDAGEPPPTVSDASTVQGAESTGATPVCTVTEKACEAPGLKVPNLKTICVGESIELAHPAVLPVVISKSSDGAVRLTQRISTLSVLVTVNCRVSVVLVPIEVGATEALQEETAASTNGMGHTAGHGNARAALKRSARQRRAQIMAIW
jgi:hypothetical protein